MADECLIDIEVGEDSPVAVTVGEDSAVNVSVGESSAVAVTLGESSGINVSVGEDTPINVSVSADGVVVVIGESDPIDVEIQEVVDVEEFLQTVEEFAARPRPVQRKLVAWTTAINVAGTTPVEMPTALVCWPFFRDSGFLDFFIGGVHANMNSTTITLELLMGPANNLVTVATYTSPAINVAGTAGSFQWEARFLLKSQGPVSHNFSGLFTWNDPAGRQTDPIIGRVVASGAYTGFGDPNNGDHGDVEARLQVSMSASGPTMNVRNVSIFLVGERSGA